MMKLYEIADRYQLITDMLDDPEKMEMVFDTLDSMEGELQDKLMSIGKLIRNYNADEEALKAESKRLKERADASKKQAEKLESYVKFVMQKSGFKKLETPLFKYSLRPSTSLVVTDLEQVPEHFLKPQPPKPDIAGLKKHLKQVYDEKGLEIPEELPELGVKFETKESLQIK